MFIIQSIDMLANSFGYDVQILEKKKNSSHALTHPSQKWCTLRGAADSPWKWDKLSRKLEMAQNGLRKCHSTY